MRKPFCLLIVYNNSPSLHREIGTRWCFIGFKEMFVRMLLRRLLTFLNVGEQLLFIMYALNFFLCARCSLRFFFLCLPYLYKYSGLLH